LDDEQITERVMSEIREIRDQIDQQIQEWLADSQTK
jgi:hypothetical protein